MTLHIQKGDKHIEHAKVKKSGSKTQPESYLNLVAAILNLVIALLLLVEKHTE